MCIRDSLYTGLVKTELADDFYYLCPAQLDEELAVDLNWYTAAAFRVLGGADVSRVDFRLDRHDNDKPYILEINPLPGLAPGYSDFPMIAERCGMDYPSLIGAVLSAALRRAGLPGRL